MQRKVLLTGAAGRIGRAFYALYRERYDFRLVDCCPDRIGNSGDHKVIQMNVADLDACQDVCRDIDTVLHLAADPSASADFYESLLENNIKGMYNMFRAAKDQGCQRIVWASSVQVIAGYPLDVQARPESPPKPMNMYGAAKSFGEATAHYFAYAEGLSAIAVRVGSFEHNPGLAGKEPDARTLSTFVSARDLSHLFVQCIEADDVQFAVVQAVSDNRFKRMDITSTRESVGYAPQDDAFQLFETGIRYRDRWYKEQRRDK